MRPMMDMKERLMKSIIVDEITKCWLWQKEINKNGYGVIYVLRTGKLAHRISYQTFKGPIMEHVLHISSCPNRCCINPDHLYDGNPYENAQDTIKVGHHFQVNKIYCPQGHPYNSENTYTNSEGKRQCKTCIKERSKSRYELKKAGFL